MEVERTCLCCQTAYEKEIEKNFKFIYCVKNTNDNECKYYLEEAETRYAHAFNKNKVEVVRVKEGSYQYKDALRNTYINQTSCIPEDNIKEFMDWKRRI
jgi:hypothetical protein